MTVATTTNSITYAGNGTTTAFATGFPFLEASHLTVVLVDDATNAADTQSLGTDYTVTGVAVPTGGTVTFAVAPPTGKTVRIVRLVPATQESDYTATGTFPAESHERALDKLTMLVQQILNALGGIDGTNGLFFAYLGNNGFAWDGQGLTTINFAQGLTADSLVTLAQAQALLQGGQVANLTGQLALVFDGDGIIDTFTLTGIKGAGDADVNVFIDGVHQRPTAAYTVVDDDPNPDQIVFSQPPPDGTKIVVVRSTGVVTALIGDGIVVTGSIADLAVTAAKIAPGANGTFLRSGTSVASWVPLIASYITDFNDAVRLNRLDQMAQPTVSVNFGSQRLIAVADGVNSNHAATVGQVNTAVANTGPVFLAAPVTIFANPSGHFPGTGTAITNTASFDWTTSSTITAVPAGTRTLILDGEVRLGGPDGATQQTSMIQTRKDGSSPALVGASSRSSGGNDATGSSCQWLCPLTASRTFQYRLTNTVTDGSVILRVIGYIP